MANTVSKTESNPRKFFDPKIDPAAYNVVARNSQLSLIQLIGSDFNVQPSFFDKNDKVGLKLCYGIHDVWIDLKNEICSAIFHYEIVGKIGRKHVMTAKADIMTVYDIPSGSTENESKAFCARVGLFAAYPYFRSLFAHLASVANLEVPMLPVLSAVPLVKTSGSQSARLGVGKVRAKKSEKAAAADRKVRDKKAKRAAEVKPSPKSNALQSKRSQEPTP